MRLPRERVVFYLVLLTFAGSMSRQAVHATDYFLTLGGGYNPRGNQASLEANVLFFQQVLREEHHGDKQHTIFFADGDDQAADLQFSKPASWPAGPVTNLLSAIHSRGADSGEVDYRNHQVPQVAGPIAPKNIENSLRGQASTMRAGDRLIIYATAHGEKAKRDNEYNTFISCWDQQRFSAAEFASWLEDVPQEVPVIMVMAQCYCGGYAHTIFEDVDVQNGLVDRLRCGFFAQQHDLPAAGCRPDIENDEEYSSFFWGAFHGRSRNGRVLTGVDCDANGAVSFAEAHAEAVITSHTIDIPLRTSEVLLRQYSRIDGYEHRGGPAAVGRTASNDHDNATVSVSTSSLAPMTGNLRDFSRAARLDQSRIIVELSQQLGVALEDDVGRVFEEQAMQARRLQDLRRSGWRGRRDRSSGRRELRGEIAEKWPDLAERNQWQRSPLLEPDNQQTLLEQLQELPHYQEFSRYLERRQTTSAEAQAAELREVKLQRLINVLEAVVLAKNLPLIADAELIARYEQMLQLEESELNAQ